MIGAIGTIMRVPLWARQSAAAESPSQGDTRAVDGGKNGSGLFQ